MNRAMFVAASGMAAQQTQLDVITDNLANADVAGFKGAVASFSDVREGRARGLGVISTGTRSVFEQGKIERSGGPLDLAIDGPGFFALTQAGRAVYTRSGVFERGADGSIQTADGWRLRGVRIPADALSLKVDPDGRVWCARPGSDRVACGRIDLALFSAPEQLQALGGARFAATLASGPAHPVRAGLEGGPKLAFGMLERSNVSIVTSMMQILTAQRAYEANAKGVQAADEMQRMANNLHRG